MDDKNKEGVITEDGDITINPVPRRFASMAEFLVAPDPEFLEPRKVSPWAFWTGDNHYFLLSSEDVPFAQQKTKAARLYEALIDVFEGVAGQAYYKNAQTQAANADNASLSTLIVVTLAAISVFGVLIFGAIVLQSRLG